MCVCRPEGTGYPIPVILHFIPLRGSLTEQELGWQPASPSDAVSGPHSTHWATGLHVVTPSFSRKFPYPSVSTANALTHLSYLQPLYF